MYVIAIVKPFYNGSSKVFDVDNNDIPIYWYAKHEFDRLKGSNDSDDSMRIVVNPNTWASENGYPVGTIFLILVALFSFVFGDQESLDRLFDIPDECEKLVLFEYTKDVIDYFGFDINIDAYDQITLMIQTIRSFENFKERLVCLLHHHLVDAFLEKISKEELINLMNVPAKQQNKFRTMDHSKEGYSSFIADSRTELIEDIRKRMPKAYEKYISLLAALEKNHQTKLSNGMTVCEFYKDVRRQQKIDKSYEKHIRYYHITASWIESTKCGVEARQILEERNCLETQIKAIENEARRRKNNPKNNNNNKTNEMDTIIRMNK